MNILLFEDGNYKNLFPLNILRPNFEIKCGVSNLLAKNLIRFPEGSSVSLHVRKTLQEYTAMKYPEAAINKIDLKKPYVFLNSKVIYSKFFFENLPKVKGDVVLIDKNKTVLYATASGANFKKIAAKVTKGMPLGLVDFKKPKVKVSEYKDKGVKVIEYAWDTLRHLEEELKRELNFLCKDSNTLTHPKAKVAPIVILDDSQGKIYVSEHAVIEPFSYIKGPCFIGKNALVKSGSKIYGPVSIGEGSRVSGEISGSIFHARVNKQHDGFVGNSYFSEFVNLGADTVTSNLKNNYSKVRAKLFKKEYETDLQFLGSIVGDHTKIGINTMLNTGTVIGAFANIAGGGFPDKFIDSFSWYIIGKKPVKYKIPDALKTAEIVMTRRGIKMTKEFEKLIKSKY
jgi:UDP-N-acetylglucosamine diphosphorylase/glucosamine-1-phosphate N-acetyltransferase